MDIMHKLILGMIACVVLLAPSVSAAPQSLSDAQIEQIRRNCQASQGYLQQIQRNDAAARINRGVAYESLTKAVANFNSRVALNKLNGSTLVTVTSDLRERVSTFQADYLLYEDALSSTLTIKCREQPVTFYDTLTNARDLRARLSKDIVDINTLLDQYQVGLTALRATFEPAKTEASQ
jgi:hypothetical protein